MTWHPRHPEVRSSGWSGTEQRIDRGRAHDTFNIRGVEVHGPACWCNDDNDDREGN